MNKQERNKIDYIVVCIHDFADRYGMNYTDACNYLQKFGAIQFLDECYDIEHTLGIEDALDDMTLIARNHGGHIG
jgi:hypothetical protein